MKKRMRSLQVWVICFMVLLSVGMIPSAADALPNIGNVVQYRDDFNGEPDGKTVTGTNSSYFAVGGYRSWNSAIITNDPNEAFDQEGVMLKVGSGVFSTTGWDNASDYLATVGENSGLAALEFDMKIHKAQTVAEGILMFHIKVSNGSQSKEIRNVVQMYPTYPFLANHAEIAYCDTAYKNNIPEGTIIHFMVLLDNNGDSSKLKVYVDGAYGWTIDCGGAYNAIGSVYTECYPSERFTGEYVIDNLCAYQVGDISRLAVVEVNPSDNVCQYTKMRVSFNNSLTADPSFTVQTTGGVVVEDVIEKIETVGNTKKEYILWISGRADFTDYEYQLCIENAEDIFGNNLENPLVTFGTGELPEAMADQEYTGVSNYADEWEQDLQYWDDFEERTPGQTLYAGGAGHPIFQNNTAYVTEDNYAYVATEAQGIDGIGVLMSGDAINGNGHRFYTNRGIDKSLVSAGTNGIAVYEFDAKFSEVSDTTGDIRLLGHVGLTDMTTNKDFKPFVAEIENGLPTVWTWDASDQKCGQSVKKEGDVVHCSVVLDNTVGGNSQLKVYINNSLNYIFDAGQKFTDINYFYFEIYPGSGFSSKFVLDNMRGYSVISDDDLMMIAVDPEEVEGDTLTVMFNYSLSAAPNFSVTHEGTVENAVKSVKAVDRTNQTWEITLNKKAFDNPDAVYTLRANATDLFGKTEVANVVGFMALDTVTQEYEFSPVSLLQDSTSIDDLTAGTYVLTAKQTMTNNSAKAAGVNFVLALYRTTGGCKKLEKISLATQSVSANGREVLNTSIPVDIAEEELGSYSVKTFVLDSLDTMQPLR